MVTSRQLLGVDLSKAAAQMFEQRQREKWPYLHVFPPPNSIPVHEIASIPVPVAGTPTLVVAVSVPPLHRFYLQAILQVFTGGAFLPGDAQWTVNVNTTIGSPSVQGMPVQGLIAVDVPLGSITAGNQWEFRRAYEFESLDLVQSVVTNVNLAGGFFTSGFFGYFVPGV